MSIKVHQESVTPEIVQTLKRLCPFGAFDYTGGELSINAACKGCKLCVKKGPSGVVEWQDDATLPRVDKSQWRGVAVYAQFSEGNLHPVTLELLGKARQLAAEIGEEVLAVIIGHGVEAQAKRLVSYGADRVYVYDHPALADFTISPYANAFYDFIRRARPGSVLVGATNIGRSIAPKVAARCHAGLTADCTVLEMKKNTDLVQIRPAFGGNIMAQIVSPNARPQFCTVRYKIFPYPTKPANPTGIICPVEVTEEMLASRTEVIEKTKKPELADISEADVIVACGRGFRTAADLDMARELAELLGAKLACTRPLAEAGWLEARRQIGLSGRTVKPKLIITLGISGSVQFAAGMNGSDCIVAVNSDPEASIFNIAHVGLVGDLYEIVPQLIKKIKEGGKIV